jgi:hypothetical protein
MSNDVNNSIIRLVQILLNDVEDKSKISKILIDEKISLALTLNRQWADSVDKEWITDELIRRYSVWFGEDTVLSNAVGHVAWLNSDRKRNWRYWARYREWQEEKLSIDALDSLDISTDRILSHLEDPLREDFWDRRGLVVGHVQSGKTGNYTGLICKAADAGYKIIIVLAGLHNNLRSQTQMRLDEGFLGFESRQRDNLATRIIGVGNIDSDQAIRPNYATNSRNNGDFRLRGAVHGIAPESKPWLFVVKKNKTVLDALISWIDISVANSTVGISADEESEKRKIVTNLPLLIIDDEADNASIDTGEVMVDSNGEVDEQHSPTTINRQIRKILHYFTRKAYVGYTATPFANIFIHEKGETLLEGPDLFPSSFIINLGAPSNYIGPAAIFGRPGENGRTDGLPLVRDVSEFGDESDLNSWMPIKHKNGHQPLINGEKKLPSCLVHAIDSFILSCAIRRIRGQENQHCSMLIHVTRFVQVQSQVALAVSEHMGRIRQSLNYKIGHEQIVDRLKSIWENDFMPTTQYVAEHLKDENLHCREEWNEILAAIEISVPDINVKVINGSATDVLDYSDNPNGMKVIAIGGDKLARGLTLEGLSTSYFLRSSRMYDTLMQMGRWFGYRPGYTDLCRLYTTTELITWFEHISDASDELRQEFDLMAASGGTPADYGLKVKSHPTLMITSRLKMRTAKTLYLSFSGSVVETISMFKDPEKNELNIKALESFIAKSGNPKPIPERKRGGKNESWNGALLEDVSWENVTDFLQQYQTHPEAHKVNGAMLSDFIKKMAYKGELTSWTVALVGGGVVDKSYRIAGIDIPMMKRSGNNELHDRYAIGRLLSPRDEGIDIDEECWLEALAQTKAAWHIDPGRSKRKDPPEEPSGLSLRNVRGFGINGANARPDRGLLLIYMLDPESSGLSLNFEFPVVAFGISFPGSKVSERVEYRVTNLLWEDMYGASE